MEEMLNNYAGDKLIGKRVINNYINPKRSPLHYLHEQLGAKFISFGDCLWVDRYEDSLEAEYHHLHENMGVVDISPLTMIKITGNDLFQCFQKMFTNNLMTAKMGDLRYGCLVSADGKLFDDVIVFVKSSNEVIITTNVDFYSFERFVKNHSVNFKITDITENYIKLQLQGPNAINALRYLFPSTTPPNHFKFIEIEDSIVSASGYSRVSGYELFIPVHLGENVWLKLKDINVQPYGISVMEVSRLEGRLICNGHEYFTYQLTPEEIGFNFPCAQSFDDARSQFVFFTLTANYDNSVPIAAIGDSIDDEHNAFQGVITSFAYSPFYRSYIGFCHLLVPLSKNPRKLFYKGNVIDANTFSVGHKKIMDYNK